MRERPEIRARTAFLPLTTAALAALAAGDLARAGALLGRPLPTGVDDDRWLWALRAEQVGRAPDDLDWPASASR